MPHTGRRARMRFFRKMKEYQRHNIPPFCEKDAEILILGSFPSVKSREIGFFYGHKQNRFWDVLSVLFCCVKPSTIEEKKKLLRNNKVALWDVVAECEIVGSADSKLSVIKENDIEELIKNTGIKRIFTNGKKASALYNQYVLPKTGLCDICLPSTSPANAIYTMEKLIEKWCVILK